MNTAIIGTFENLALDRLHESSTNPRRYFDDVRLAELAESIRLQGLVQPIVARPNSAGYEIVAGARRYRAARLAQVEEIPVRIVTLSDEQALEWQLIENSQRQDIHPYEEAQAYQRLLEMPGYDVVALAEKTGKTQSHVYTRLKLLSLIDSVAAAFLNDHITATHAGLIARLPQDRQAEAFEQCWRKDFRDSDRHLLPAKNLAEWLESNIYLNLTEAPFDTDDAILFPQAGACPDCPKQSGFNTKLFSDVHNDVCLDATCWNTKVSASLQRTMEQRPNLVQINNGWAIPKDRKPGVLDRSSYQLITVPTRSEGGNEDGFNTVNPCSSGTDALIVQGNSVGSIVRVCTDPHCPTHGRPLPNPAEQEERNRQMEQQRRQEETIRQQRKFLYNRIVSAAPGALTLDQWKFIFRAVIDSDFHSICDSLASQYEPDPPANDQRTAETVLLDVIQAADQKAMSAFILRFALIKHISSRNPEEFDYLKEAETTFLEDAKPKIKRPDTKANRSKGKVARSNTKRKR